MDAEELSAARFEDIFRALDLLNEISRAYDGLAGNPNITKAINALRAEVMP